MSEIKKPKNRFELDPERLATTDEKGNRVYLYPEDVKGVWKTRRQIVYWALIALYLTLPWIYINGRPALMANIFKREFSFFGAVFYGVDPLLFFLITISWYGKKLHYKAISVPLFINIKSWEIFN